jgi:hypothetical protein
MANLPTERRRLIAMAGGTNMLDMLRRGAGVNDPHEVPRIPVFDPTSTPEKKIKW